MNYKEQLKKMLKILMVILLIATTIFFVFLIQQTKKEQKKINNLEMIQTKLDNMKDDFINSKEIVEQPISSIDYEINQYISQKQNFVEIDLTKMKVSLYKEGEVIKTFKVLTKGREGSWWETPTGKYKIISKEENHFSSIGKVWMPWSMQFYGNFFIHGWPYHQNGEEVSSSYSGGCVRVSTEDAKEIYEFVEKNTTIFLKDEEDPKQFGTLNKINDFKAPTLDVKSFLISNLATEEVILEKNSKEVLPIASLTKLMTGVVSSELIYLGRSIHIDQNILSSSQNTFNPTKGENYIAFDLLYPLLMQSSNEASRILADFIGRNYFIDNMNKKAISLSMNNTNFGDTSGELASNTSNTEDLSKLLRYIYFKRKFILDITKGKQDYRFEGRKLDNLKNFNELIEEEKLVGIKNGKTTSAKETIAGVWEFETKTGKVPISIIILGSEDRERDTETLIDWLKQNFEFI